MPDDKLKQCPLAQGRFEPCPAYKRLKYCPSEVIRKQGGGCPLLSQRQCKHCKEVKPTEEFYGDDYYCIACRKEASTKQRGGKSHRLLTTICDLDSVHCPKSNGLKCGFCKKTRPTPPNIPMPGGQR